MPKLLIAVDIRDEHVRVQFVREIRQLSTRWARPLASIWMIETTLPISDVNALLTPLLDIDDGLVVQDAEGPGALTNTLLRWTAGSAAPTDLQGSSAVVRPKFTRNIDKAA